MRTIENATLTRVGDALALVFDESMLKFVGFNSETRLRIDTDGRALMIQSQDAAPPITEDELRASMQKMTSRYEASFRKLAE